MLYLFSSLYASVSMAALLLTPLWNQVSIVFRELELRGARVVDSQYKASKLPALTSSASDSRGLFLKRRRVKISYIKVDFPQRATPGLMETDSEFCYALWGALRKCVGRYIVCYSWRKFGLARFLQYMNNNLQAI